MRNEIRGHHKSSELLSVFLFHFGSFMNLINSAKKQTISSEPVDGRRLRPDPPRLWPLSKSFRAQEDPGMQSGHWLFLEALMQRHVREVPGSIFVGLSLVLAP